MTAVRKIFITGLGSGYLPIAPGTWGSAFCVAVLLGVVWVVGGAPLVTNMTLGAIVVLATVGCIVWGRAMERDFGRKDPSHCTLDEWAGQAVALLLLPMGNDWTHYLLATGLGFIAFRIFDIVKPPPARMAERLPRGLGVVADDLVAGLYANLLVQVILRSGVSG